MAKERKHKPSVPKGAKKKKDENWKPSEVHLAWYREWTIKHRRMTDIAIDAGVTRQAIWHAVHAVKEWLRLELFDQIVEFRERQTECLDQMASEALESWRASKGLHKVTTTKKCADGNEVATREEELCGDPRFLAEARSAMADIREMWGVNKPQKIEVVDDEGNGFERVAGMTRAQAIKARAERLMQRAKHLEAQKQHVDSGG